MKVHLDMTTKTECMQWSVCGCRLSKNELVNVGNVGQCMASCS